MLTGAPHGITGEMLISVKNKVLVRVLLCQSLTRGEAPASSPLLAGSNCFAEMRVLLASSLPVMFHHWSPGNTYYLLRVTLSETVLTPRQSDGFLDWTTLPSQVSVKNCSKACHVLSSEHQEGEVGPASLGPHSSASQLRGITDFRRVHKSLVVILDELHTHSFV